MNSTQPRFVDWNERFGLKGQLTFCEGEGGLPKIEIANVHATAEIYLFGGQVLQYTPVGKTPVLWQSPLAVFNGEKAIRGGIPICWPWFMAHPTDPSLPAHGFARNREWSVASTNGHSDGSTTIQLQLLSDETTRPLFPHEFRLLLTVNVGPRLDVRLQIENTGESAFTSGTALHSYFSVDDITNVRCAGLENVEFTDNLDEHARKTETAAFAFVAETERVYIPSVHTIKLNDDKRTLEITKSGSESTIVWNPWIEKAKATSDCNDDGYQQFVCVETANVGDDQRSVGPNETHVIQQVIQSID